MCFAHLFVPLHAQKMKISIITVTYNSARTVKDTLESVLRGWSVVFEKRNSSRHRKKPQERMVVNSDTLVTAMTVPVSVAMTNGISWLFDNLFTYTSMM